MTTRFALSSHLRCLVTAWRVMARCLHNSRKVCPLLSCNRSSNCRRLGSARALKTSSTASDYATKRLHVNHTTAGLLISAFTTASLRARCRTLSANVMTLFLCGTRISCQSQRREDVLPCPLLVRVRKLSRQGRWQMDTSKAIFDVLLMLGTAGKEKIKKACM